MNHAKRNNTPRICFVAPNNYALLSGRTDIMHIGGAEVQRTLIARELAGRGYSVSFVTLDHGQLDGITHDGIQVFKLRPLSDGLPGIRFFHPRWTGLCAAMARANADIYYQRTAGVETGQVALWCRRNRRAFVFGVANDPECDGRLGGENRVRRERWLYRYGLMHADAVVAQTSTQQKMLAENFGIDATVIRSCAPEPLPPTDPLAPEQRLVAGRVLWVGRFRRHKRLDWVLELARACPQLHFDIVGACGTENSQIREVEACLENLTNTTLHGFLPHDQIGCLYDRAAVLLSTSVWEGYPNVFLEAWSRGVPTVSTLDPDGVVTASGLGLVAETVPELKQGLQTIMSAPEKWAMHSQNARRFFEQNHTVATTVDGLETVWDKLGYGQST